MHSTDAKIRSVQPRAAGALVKLHKLFAFLKGPQHRCHRADIHRQRWCIQEMIEDARYLGKQHPDVLTAWRWRNTEQLLRSQYKRVFLTHRGDVIETVKIWHRLEIGFVLDQLLSAAV